MLSEFNTECHSQPAALSGLGIEYQSQPAAAPETPRNDPPTPPVLSENQELQQQIQKLKTEMIFVNKLQSILAQKREPRASATDPKTGDRSILAQEVFDV
ncbi:hypothetical protein RJZ90_002991 [Blastomyces dermatitidis]